MIISERIFCVMEQKNITQLELSRRTGIATSNISDWKKKTVTVRVAVSAWFRFRVVWSRVRGVAGAGSGSTTAGSSGFSALPLPPNSSTPTSTAASTTTSTTPPAIMERCLRWTKAAGGQLLVAWGGVSERGAPQLEQNFWPGRGQAAPHLGQRFMVMLLSLPRRVSFRPPRRGIYRSGFYIPRTNPCVRTILYSS